MPDHTPPTDQELDDTYRDDVREILEAEGWHETAEDCVVASNGALWAETNDSLDSSVDAPDKSWSVAFDSGVPASVIAAVAVVAGGTDLVAEVRRLRARVGDLEARHLPKLCECGHTRLVHTVPAPHGCFAGKIKGAEPCDCGEYRQLSFAEAERRIAERHAARAEQRAATEETHVIADDQTVTDRAILKAAPESSDDWDDATWAAWWRTAERVHGDRPAVRPAAETGA